MTLQTFFIVWAALSGAVFPLASFADDEQPVIEKTVPVKTLESKPTVEWSKMEITRGNNVNPHQPPNWFVRMVPPTPEYPPEIQSFVFKLPDVASYVGKPPRIGRKYACQQSDKSWIFCD